MMVRCLEKNKDKIEEGNERSFERILHKQFTN
jgi:hypothetical protein